MSAAELPIDWEETACPLCDSRASAPMLEARDPNLAPGGPLFAVVRCKECGFCYTNPRPSESSIGRFYPPDYEPHAQPSSARPRRFRWRRRLTNVNSLERRVLALRKPGRLLDLGCGSGAFLERMHHHGWQVTGLDIAAGVVQRIRDGLGLRALVGTLPHPELAPESFDVITIWQTLEHLHQPREALCQAFRLLAPGGTLVVTVPSIDSGPFRLFGCGWYGLELPRHLSHFTPATLRQMVHRAGFSVTSQGTLRHSDWIRRSVRLSARLGCGPGWLRLLNQRWVSSALSRYWQLVGRSDCLLLTAVRPDAGPTA